MDKFNIKIIYEDNHLLVVEKPVNIPSQADDTGDADMINLLKEYIKEKYNKPGEVYLGLVHRLDRPVGGIMVFARTSKAASRLSEQMRNREFKKTYVAVINGVLENNKGRLHDYLLKDEGNNTVHVVGSSVKGAKEAMLEYDVIGGTKGYCLVKVELHTGRSHQIRVQFANAGHPLYGDQKYGPDINKPRQQIALWSSKVVFMHPTKPEELVFECPPPKIEPWNWF